MVNQERQLPEVVKNDQTIRTYKLLDGDKVVAYFEREDTPNDVSAKIENTLIISPPTFYGEWKDKTEEYLSTHQDKKQNRSGRARTVEEIRKEELLKAQRMLAELLLNMEQDNQSPSQTSQKEETHEHA